MNVSVDLSLESTHDENYIRHRHQTEASSIHNLKKHFVGLKDSSEMSLYAVTDFQNIKNDITNFCISFL